MVDHLGLPTEILRLRKTKCKGLLILVTEFNFLTLASKKATTKKKIENAYYLKAVLPHYTFPSKVVANVSK